MTPTTPDPSPTATTPGDWLELVRKSASNLKFGSIQITVHEGRVTQIESIEKVRFIASRDETTTKQK